MKTRVWLLIGLLAWLLSSLGLVQPALAQDSGSQVLVLTADGPLTPVMAEYLERGLNTASSSGTALVVFKLNTPGGSISLMNRMVTDIRNSSVPVVVYVAPSGAMAASAGTLITLAGQAAAMAPETTIGAASPVDSNGQDLGQTMEAKVKNDLKATVRTLAARRGPLAVDMAEKAIDDAAAASAKEALDAGLVDFIASDVNDLLHQLNGFKIETTAGERVLTTLNAAITDMPATFVERVLRALTDPNIIILLLNVGVIAILIELATPGGWVAGFVGVVCLALAVYGLGIIPVNWFGLVFVALAFVLFVLDIKAPTHGALTAAGVGSLMAGGLVLFNSATTPGFERVSIPLVVASSLLTGALFFGVLLFALRAQRKPLLTGQQILLGKIGIARSAIDPTGQVHLEGEMWSAEVEAGSEPIPAGARVEVLRLDGLKLMVRKAL